MTLTSFPWTDVWPGWDCRPKPVELWKAGRWTEQLEEHLKCLSAQVGGAVESLGFEILHHRASATCWQWVCYWNPENCWQRRNRLLCSTQPSSWSNKPSLPFSGATQRQKCVFCCSNKKCLHSKDVFTLRMSRAEDEKREERRILLICEVEQAGEVEGKRRWFDCAVSKEATQTECGPGQTGGLCYNGEE